MRARATLACALGLLAAGSALAQTAPATTTASEDASALLAPTPHSTRNPLLAPGRNYRGIAVADWMLYPAVTAGVTFDDNLVWSATRPVAAGGFRLGPEIVAVRDKGGSKTTVYGNLDTRLFPSVGRADTLGGQAGVEQDWKVQHDLSVKAKAEVSRSSVAIGSNVVATGGGVVATIASPLIEDKASGSLAVQKTFGRMFVGGSFDISANGYHALYTSNGWINESYRNSRVETGAVRAGAWISPEIYAFGEASGNARDYAQADYASKGYRVIAGLGSDRISLFRGEIFAGYQQQRYTLYQLGTGSSPVFGGHIFWYPTRTLTVNLTLDQTFSDSNLPTASNPAGYPNKATTTQLNVTFKPNEQITAIWRGAYEHAVYLSSTRRDDGWRTGIGLSYMLYRNIDLLFNYDFSKVFSTDSNGGYTRNSVGLGMKYRY